MSITHFSDLIDALDKRLIHFNQHGCRAADHGIENMCYAPIPIEKELDQLLTKRLAGETLTDQECAQFSTAVQVWLGSRYSELGWVMQLHIGAQRDNNSRMFKLLGSNTGYDSIGDKRMLYRLPSY